MAVYPTIQNVPTRITTATAGLNTLLLIIACAFGCWVVGTRGLDIGTDTPAYARFFLSLDDGPVRTRLEPGFVLYSYLLSRLGLNLQGYQAGLFALLLFIAGVASRRYWRYIGSDRGFLTFLSASVMFLYLSPMFINASINAVRQGLAALVVFMALLAFHERKWWQYLIFGGLASSIHLSSIMYLLCAPALLLSARRLRYVAAAAFLLYVSGLTMKATQIAVPALYTFVMEYTAHRQYRSGVRIDFALFSIFWYLLPHVLAPLVKEPYRDMIVRSAAVYLVMVLPFFAVGWGFYSNRYLLPAYLAVSLIVAAIVCYSRLRALRHPMLIMVGLVASCVVFYFYVQYSVLI